MLETDRLTEDLTVRDLRGAGAIADFLYLNTGTFAETSREGEFVAYFPVDSWRSVTSVEHSLLTTARPTLAESVTVLEFSHPLVAEARARLLPLLKAWGAANSAEMAKAVSAVRDDLLAELLARYGIVCLRNGPADCAVNRPGQRSTAFNFATSDYMGLHIDNHEKLSLTDRGKGLLLCCANLGSAPRYYHFINLRVHRLIEAVRVSADRSDLTSEGLKNRFMAQYPAYPVVRITLVPGEAYLCNAQDMIHDGATNTVGVPDIALLMSGNFTWRN